MLENQGWTETKAEHKRNAKKRFRDLPLAVRKVDNAIHRLNNYPADSVVCLVNTYALDSNIPADIISQPLNNRGLGYGQRP